MTQPPRSRAITRRRFLREGGALAVTGLAVTSMPVRAARALGSAPSVVVLGGGVSGLSAAHELAERGFKVTVIERKALGGKAKSLPVPGTGTGGRMDLPAEHGFRAEFGFYQNLSETMSRIPYPGNSNGVLGNVKGVGHGQLARSGGEEDVTLPLDASAFQHTTYAQFWQSVIGSLRSGSEVPPDQLAFFARQLAIFMTSCEERRYGQWEYVNWWDFLQAEQMSEEYRLQFADGTTRNLAAAKPQDMSVNSVGIAGESFAYSAAYRPDGPVDRALNAPTNEAWIDPWVTYLRGLGVQFRVGEAVERLRLTGNRVAAAVVRDPAGRRGEVTADWFVSAVPVERAISIFDSAILSLDPSLDRLKKLRTEWMNGVIFHLNKEVPICNGHVNYIDSEFALTSISQAQHWDRNIPAQYGDGRAVESFSTIISDWTRPGMIYNKPAWSLRPEQVIREVWEQCKAHLNDTGTTVLRDDMIVSAFIDTAIEYPASLAGQERIARNDEPLLINTPGSWDDRPEATTAIPNLMLAGDYVRCTMNVATMESACETGRKAARVISAAAGKEAVTVFDRWVPPENEPLKQTDAKLYARGLPHALDTPWPDTITGDGLGDETKGVREILRAVSQLGG
jgi:uncharacterized protein with NAD-binding domain and iron-sulfur cluster